MQLSFEDRTYLVTGGGSGIGKGVAEGLAKAGANVMIVGRGADRLAATADEINAAAPSGSVRYEPADVTNEDQIAAVVDAATAWNGRLHGVVHCAGGSQTIGPITQMDSEAWRATVDLNINGSMYVLKHSARQMVRGGGADPSSASPRSRRATHIGGSGRTASPSRASTISSSWLPTNSERRGCGSTASGPG